MSLGDESAQVALKMSKELMEAFSSLLKYLLNSGSRQYDIKIKKEQLKNLREKNDSQLIGHVRASKMFNSNQPYTIIKEEMTDKEFKEFSRLAKKGGLTFSSIKNKVPNENGTTTRLVMVYEKDLELTLDITKVMQRNMKLKFLENEKNNLNPEISAEDNEKADILDALKKDIIDEDVRDFNNESKVELFNKICNDKKNESLTFNRALNHFTETDYSKDEPYYICERTDPDKYMELESKRAVFNNEEYTRTEYRVFNGEKEIKNSNREDGVFTDEKFEGRPNYFWPQLRKQMKETGEFTDDVIIFSNKKELNEYQERYRDNIKELRNKEIATYGNNLKDYAGAQNKLLQELKVKGYEESNGLVIVNTGEELSDISFINDTNYVEASIMCKQIKNYREMNELQKEIQILKQQYEINSTYKIENENITEIQKNLESEIRKLEISMDICAVKEVVYISEREAMTGIRTEEELTINKSNSILNSPHGEEKITVQELDNKIAEIKETNSISSEKVSENTMVENVKDFSIGERE